MLWADVTGATRQAQAVIPSRVVTEELRLSISVLRGVGVAAGVVVDVVAARVVGGGGGLLG